MKKLLAPLFALAAFAGLTAAEPINIAVIPKGTTHEYWKAVQAGTVKAQRELVASGVSVNVIYKGPLKEDDREQQVQVVENFIGRHVSAIVISQDYKTTGNWDSRCRTKASSNSSRQYSGKCSGRKSRQVQDLLDTDTTLHVGIGGEGPAVPAPLDYTVRRASEMQLDG